MIIISFIPVFSKRIFRPSPALEQPYVMPCVNVIAADTDQEAARLATSLYQMFIGIITGRRTRLQPPVDNMNEIWTEYEQEAAKQMLQLSLIGSADTIKEKLEILLEKTGMNEIMIISNIYDQEAKLHSYELFAQIMKEL